MRGTKKVVSVILVMAVILAIIPIGTLPVSATTNGYTRESAANYMLNTIVGTGWNVDGGGNGYDCKDLALKYFEDVGGLSTYEYGHARIYSESATLPEGWTRRYYSNGYAPQKGDMACWGTEFSEHGHVALVYDVADTYIYVVEQSSRKNTAAYTTYYRISSPKCYVVPDFHVSVPNGFYVFHCVAKPDRVLDIQGNSKARDANIQLYDALYNQEQKFRVTKDPNNDYYYIQSVYSGMWLDIAYPFVDDGCNIKLWDSNDSKEQKWVFEDAGDGNVYIRSLYGVYVDTGAGGPTANNSNIQTWHFDGTTTQQWKLERTSPYERAELSNGTYVFHNVRNPARVMDIQGNSKENRANIQLYDDLNNDVQRFYITKENNYYLIQSAYSGYWLDIQWPYNTSGCNIQLYNDYSMPEEKWVFEDAGNGRFLIRSLHGTYVDLKNGQTANNTNIQTYTYDESNSMEWFLHPVYSVKYDANGGTGAPATQGKQWGINLTLSSSVPTRAGYTFVDWNTRPDNLGDGYAPGGIYSGNVDVTLYAIWRVAEGPEVSSDKNTYRVGETASFSFSAPSANSLHFYIYKDNTLYFQGQYAPNATYSRTLYQTETGHYTYYIIAHYNGQDVTSIVKSFDVEGDYTIDLNAYIDGEYYYGSHSAGLVDVYINGELSQADVSDYCQTFPNGTRYEIKNIRPATGYYYGGSTIPTSGVIDNEDVNIIVCFNTSSSTLKIDPNGGFWNESVAVQSFTQQYNTTLAIPVPVREGYVFAGWERTGEYGNLIVVSDNASEYVFGALNGTEDTLKAQWIKTFVLGDATGDGEIDLRDVAQLTRYIAGGWDVTVDASAADVNKDGTVDLKDVVLLRRYLSGGWGVQLD